MAKEDGVEFEKGAAEDLAESVSADFSASKPKLRNSPRTQAKENSSAAATSLHSSSPKKTATVWELADMLATRQSKTRARISRSHLREGEQPLQILGALTWSYRKLMEASELRGVNNGYQAARALSMNPLQAELALQSARKNLQAPPSRRPQGPPKSRRTASKAAPNLPHRC